MMVTTFLEQRPCTSAMMTSDWLEQASVFVNMMVAGLKKRLCAKVNLSYKKLYTVDTHFFAAILCPKLANPENGRVWFNGVTPSSIADYSCNKGFKLVGDAWRKCQPNGEWSGEAPTCKRKKLS